MAVTPEGKIKARVKNILTEFGGEYTNVDGFACRALKHYWPVPSGMGASDIDCIVCYYGRYISIETKAPGKKPTPRQDLTLAETKAAGGISLVIASMEDCDILLRNTLHAIREAACNQP